jgi:hypothetical protein
MALRNKMMKLGICLETVAAFMGHNYEKSKGREARKKMIKFSRVFKGKVFNFG